MVVTTAPDDDDGEDRPEAPGLAEAVARMGAISSALRQMQAQIAAVAPRLTFNVPKIDFNISPGLDFNVPQLGLPELTTALAQSAFRIPASDLSGINFPALQSAVAAARVIPFELPPSSLQLARLALQVQAPSRRAMKDFEQAIEAVPELSRAVDEAVADFQRSKPALSKIDCSPTDCLVRLCSGFRGDLHTAPRQPRPCRRCAGCHRLERQGRC